MSYDEQHRFFLYDGFAALCGVIAIASAVYSNYENAVMAAMVAIALITIRPLVVKAEDPHGHH
jgi:CRISPR/Cas system-associated protein Csm6